MKTRSILLVTSIWSLLSLSACVSPNSKNQDDSNAVNAISSANSSDASATTPEEKEEDVLEAALVSIDKIEDREEESTAAISEVAPPALEIAESTQDSENSDPNSLHPFCSEHVLRNPCRIEGEKSYKSAHYERCIIPETRTVLSGDVEISFNNSSCEWRGVGDILARKQNLLFARMHHAATLKVSSEPHLNYREKRIGGGDSLERTENGWIYKILGEHIVFNNLRRRGIESNISVRTRGAIEILGTLSPRDRTINGGAFVVDHNLAKFTAVYKPEKLSWQGNDCKCPVSGSLYVKYFGSIQAEGKIIFQGCGKALYLSSNANVQREVKHLRACF